MEYISQKVTAYGQLVLVLTLFSRVEMFSPATGGSSRIQLKFI